MPPSKWGQCDPGETEDTAKTRLNPFATLLSEERRRSHQREQTLGFWIGARIASHRRCVHTSHNHTNPGGRVLLKTVKRQITAAQCAAGTEEYFIRTLTLLRLFAIKVTVTRCHKNGKCYNLESVADNDSSRLSDFSRFASCIDVRAYAVFFTAVALSGHRTSPPALLTINCSD
ncbi:hypothetical protein JOB18_023434 [Solea senegalensis]|uniref:Uncharacterized protein n=1 Tax=Solea senegalensis TaxID=28829 RepID=A0AAV6RF49_SOLSE|nr:hypothetical protein JOB18_023434 [Solea senegalensis]